MKVTLTMVPSSETNTGKVELMLMLEVVSAEESLSEVVLRLMTMSGAKEVLVISVIVLLFTSYSSLWRETKIPPKTRKIENKTKEWRSRG